MSINWKQFTQLVRAANDIVLTSHIRPDCDALGSELGMADVLRGLGKRVRIVNGQATPPNLTFIDSQNEILVWGQSVSSEQLRDVDLVIILDTSAWAQLAPLRPFLESTSAKKIILDHHVSQDDLGAIPFKDTSAEATGRLVVEAADQLGVKLTAQAAVPLFAALATDTGWFRFGSTTQETYRLAARLVDAGAVPAQIYADLYENESLGRVRLRGIVLSRVETELDGALVYTHILLDDFEKSGALPSDTEDLINQALEIHGTLFAVIMIEQPTGGFKISFRSRCGLSCNDVAAQFGGGGHQAAAGAYLKGDYSVVSDQVLSHVRQRLSEFLELPSIGAHSN
jgi:phosphoesterase RecJ-like protein